MACRDHLVEEIGCVLVERQISQLVTNKECRLGVSPQLADQGVIDLGGQEMIQHIHGGGEEHALIGLTGAPGDDFGEEGFAHAGVAHQHKIGSLGEELQVEQAQDARLGLLACLMVLELKGVNARLRLQSRTFIATLDGALFAGLQLQIGQPFQSGGSTEIFRGRFSQGRLHAPAHGGESQLIQFLFERSHQSPFRSQE